MKRFVLLANMLLLLVIAIIIQEIPLDVTIHLNEAFKNFSTVNIFGTDNLGRDVFSLALSGGLRTWEAVVIASSISFIVGSLLGLTSGYFEGLLGEIIKSLVDLVMIVPSLISALIVTAFLGINPVTAGIALGLFGIGTYMNQANHLTIREKEKEYVQISHLLGVPWYIIVYRRIYKNILPELFVNLGNTASHVVLSYAALTFIGLGSDFVRPDWGAMLYEYRNYIVLRPTLLIVPSLCIFWTSLSIHLFFDSKHS